MTGPTRASTPRVGPVHLLRVPAFAIPLLLLQTNAASADSDATAELLFRDGKRLMAEKRFAEACPKFAESARLSPSSGVELALGLCYEAEGKSASAWGAFTAAVPLARRDARKDRERVATTHAEALEPKLARVTFEVDSATAAIPGFELREDGLTLGSAAWAGAPVDPGEHRVEAIAPGYVTFATSFTSTDDGRATVSIPALIVAPPLVASSPRGTFPWKPVGVASASAGLASLIAGAIVGEVALGKVKDAQRLCPRSPCDNTAAVSENDAAGTLADASTGLFVVGGVLAAAGTLTFLLAPGGREGVPQPATKTSYGEPVVAPGFLGWKGSF
jgi:hypothetical protein